MKRGEVSRPDIDKVKNAIDEKDLNGMCRHMANSFEEVIEEMFDIISDIRADLHAHGAVGASMSGSGPSMFGVFEDGEKAEKAARNLAKKYENRPDIRIFSAKTCPGVVIV